jgi:hypothetical protein
MSKAENSLATNKGGAARNDAQPVQGGALVVVK